MYPRSVAPKETLHKIKSMLPYAASVSSAASRRPSAAGGRGPDQAPRAATVGASLAQSLSNLTRDSVMRFYRNDYWTLFGVTL